jgi:NAD(P)-dependent dehydrogenase (short-subunit alcohol dehydrogenase family)
MKDKQILITGASSGIGKETARALGNLGAHIFFTGRHREKDLNIQEELRQDTGNPDIYFYHCDLASFESITAFTSEFKKSYKTLDILINNAGIWNSKKVLTLDGIESHLAVNYLAPFLMTSQLLPLLKNSPSARIINLTSVIHFRGKLDLDDLEFNRRKWRSIDAYTQSKLCNILFTISLAGKLIGTNISVNCIAPGWVNTGLFRDAGHIVKISTSLLAMSPVKAARGLVHLATAGELEDVSGEYFAGMNIRKSSPASYDQQLSDKLWKRSEEYLKDYI